MAAQGGAASGQSEPKGGGKLLGEIISANGSVVVWLVFLAFGGAFLSLYYSKIRYFPDLLWSDSLTYLAALSLLGGGVAVVYGLLLFIPGAMWSEFLIHDKDLSHKLCYDKSHSEPCFWSVGLFMGLPYLTFMVIIHLAALPGNFYLTTAVAAILLGVISWFLWGLFKEFLRRNEVGGVEKKEEKKPGEIAKPNIWQWILNLSEGNSKRTRLLRYVIAFDVSALASLFSTIILFSLVDSENKLGPWSAMIWICTGLVTLSNFLVAVQFRNQPFRALMTALLATLVLLACSETVDGGKTALSTGIMKKFGVGIDAPPVTIVVDPKAKAMFKELELFRPCDPIQEKIPDVLILSRLGNEYLLKMNRYQVKKEGTPTKKVLLATRVKVVVPRRHVLSWSVQPALEIRADEKCLSSREKQD